MTTAAVRRPHALQKHRIIERPRLFALLDASNARARTLVAPAGYGKSTLAEQWIGRDGRTGAWFTARRASSDVAALALGLAGASLGFVPECDARLREHLRALPAPAENVETLAEILGEDLASWPPNAWLVLDEYQEVAQSGSAERFVAALISNSPIQLLIASRQRPLWVSDRDLLYGDVLELNQSELAMDSSEAAEVLSGRSRESASGLVALANGWPAVIGLASVSSAEITRETEQVPESLYRYFAEEVFSALGEVVQAGLTILAAAPILDRELAGRLLGAEQSETVCAAALDVGVLVERAAQLQLHPLARSFLEERSGQLGLCASEETIVGCLDHYWEHRDWDAAFETISRHGPFIRLEALLKAALDELLDTARLSTVDTWCSLATEQAVDAPVVAVARAEVALRYGRHAEAQAFAEAAAAHGSDMTFRALSVAGRAAHLASREESGLDLYRRAEAVAASEDEKREAVWGQLRCLIDLESPAAGPTLEELLVGVRFGDPREVVRATGHRIHLKLRFGSVELEGSEIAQELLAGVRDPLVTSSFLSVYSTALALAGRYAEAHDAAEELLSVAEKYRLDFAVPYGLCSQALACSGLREWSRAISSVSEARGIASRSRDAHAEQICLSLLMRIHTQQGHFGAALGIDPSQVRGSLAASHAELICSRALALAVAGRTEEAMRDVAACTGVTQAVEPAILAQATTAICALKDGAANAPALITDLEQTVLATGAIDLLVVSYRSCPELLSALLHGPDRDQFHSLMRRVGDQDLAQVLGYAIAIDAEPSSRLSPREKEVFELVGQGLTNLQIAEILFISESTVKRHAHNIYGKLGTRSRRALVVQAALHRASQATSATADSDSIDES
jgi:DNA-binding CsgD family transcriptional regulator/tetratricopeptide (TPR) repeat protein